jgi:hypothetical protein
MEVELVFDEPGEPEHLLVGGIVKVPTQSIRIIGLESSQDHEDPMGDLMGLESIRLEYEGIEYDLGPYAALDNDVSETLLEWYSPT